MRKWIKRILIALGGLALALFLVIYFGGRFAVQKYLARELTVGPGKLRLVAPTFRWSLDLDADSVLYASPDLSASAGRTLVSANLFKSLLHFSPSVTLDVDTLSLRLTPGPDTAAAKPKKDSIPFPSFKLPASVVVRAGRITVFDTAADSLGPMVRADGLVLETKGPQAVALAVREALVRQLGSLTQSLSVSADWSDTGKVIARLSWRHAADSVAAQAKLAKANLLRAGLELRLHMASSAPYLKALKMKPGLPRAEGFDADFRASMQKTFRLEGGLSAKISGLPDSAPLKLGAQKMAVKIDFKDSAGTWSLTSRGDRGEDVDLRGSLFATATDSLEVPAWLAAHLGVTAKGHLRGINVDAGGKKMLADLDVADLKASGAAVRADISTGEGSRIRADLRKSESRTAAARAAPAPGKKRGKAGNPQATPSALPDWNGEFAADIVPGERWLVAFTDTNVVFTRALFRGTVKDGEVSAVTEITGLKAYGVLADSLRLAHRYGKAGYVLEPSHLYWRGTDWELTGRVGLNDPDKPMAIRMANSKYGSLEAAMPRPEVMEAHARALAPEYLPYKGLDTLKANQPRVTADFSWDKRKHSGAAKAKLEGKYKGETLQADASAQWDAERLVIQETRASMSGSEIRVSAKVRLHGRQFYELAKLGKDDFEDVSLSADHFDLAKTLSVAMPEPPLKSGTATGRFTFSAAAGFAGTYRFQNIHMNSEEEKLSLKELALIGKGDTLLIKAVTVSEQEPLFNDSASLAVTGVLAPEQGMFLRVRLGEKVYLDFQGRLNGFNELKGRLGIRGDAVLPGSSGELRDVKVRADVVFPFKQGMKGLRLEADTLGGNYLVAGLDTQTFSAPVKMLAGKIAIPRFSMRSKGGAQLDGRFEFDPPTKRMSGSLSGNSFAAQVGKGDKIKLRDLKLEFSGDSTVLNLQASIGSGSAEHIKSPMRAAGDFSQVSVTYRAPMGKNKSGVPGGGRIPFVRVDAVLDSSEIRYRLRSMETLQNLFKRSPGKQMTAKRSQAIQVQINVETAGTGNSIETDILRMKYVGNFSMSGTYPYALVQGRISSSEGELGPKKQAYAIRRMDVKWLNTPMEEGKVELEARKRLAKNCETGTLDSCDIITRLTGELANLQFTYDSDCAGASGAGVQVSALLYSVRRGCYSSAFSAGGSGLTYQEQALGLLEPVASEYLSDVVGKLSGHWISSAQVSGLGAFATDKNKKKNAAQADSGSSAAATTEAVALEILSKEFWRTRLRVRSAYAPEKNEAVNPVNYRVGLEWRPPLPGFIKDPKWQRRLKNNVNVEAAIFTNPDRIQTEQDQNSLLRRLGLNYNYDFWGYWWAKEKSERQGKGKLKGEGAQAAAARDSVP